MDVRLASLVAIIVTSAACSGPAEQPEAKPAGQPATAATSTHAVVVSQAPRGAVVLLEPKAARDFPLPPGPAIMDQYGRAFIPSVLIVRRGQVVEFRNSEDVLHNVHVQKSPAGTEVFNVDRPPFDTYRHTFDQDGFYTVVCDTHIDMRAAVVVTGTPYAAVADERGRVTFPDVEPGAYTLRLQGAGSPIERGVDVSGARTEVALGGT